MTIRSPAVKFPLNYRQLSLCSQMYPNMRIIHHLTFAVVGWNLESSVEIVTLDLDLIAELTRNLLAASQKCTHLDNSTTTTPSNMAVAASIRMPWRLLTRQTIVSLQLPFQWAPRTNSYASQINPVLSSARAQFSDPAFSRRCLSDSVYGYPSEICEKLQTDINTGAHLKWHCPLRRHPQKPLQRTCFPTTTPPNPSDLFTATTTRLPQAIWTQKGPSTCDYLEPCRPSTSGLCGARRNTACPPATSSCAHTTCGTSNSSPTSHSARHTTWACRRADRCRCRGSSSGGRFRGRISSTRSRRRTSSGRR
jgi:hypothetical protein